MIKEADQTKEQLIDELARLRFKIAELEGKVNSDQKFEIVKTQQYTNKAAPEWNQLFSILNSLPILVYLTAPDYSIRFSNLFFQERFGQPGTDPCYKVLTGQAEPCHFCKLREVINNNEPQQWEWHCPNGYIYRIYNYHFTDWDGCMVALNFGLDITEYKHAETALRLSEENFAKAFYCSPDPTSISNLVDGSYLEVNDAFLEETGYEKHEVIGKSVNSIDIWATIEERDAMIDHIKKQGRIHNCETRFRIKSGDLITALFSAEILDINGQPHLLCESKNITERKRIEEALRLSEERFSKAFNASPSTMSITTLENGRYINVNDAFCRVVGFSRDEIQGLTSLELGFWYEENVRHEITKRIKRKESIRDLEIIFRKKHGEKRLGLYSAERLDIDGEICILSIVTDITESKKSEEQIRYLSFNDKLTDLYNRAFFEEELKRLDTARKLPLSLIMGDVNGLKLINDALGHQEGDRLLLMVADILKKSCRHEDIIARWGGDEFIILLPSCDRANAYQVIDRIKNFSQNVNGLPIKTTISLGLACKEDETRDIKEVIKEAEDKMYRNKLLESRSARNSLIVSLEEALWVRSHETKEHSQRLQEIARKFGEAIQLPDSEIDNLMLLAALHDIGKIAIPNNILSKPYKLSPTEWDYIKKHPETGYRIALSSPEMAPIAEAILHHHERWDGSGYPLELKGEEIPLISRIIALIDAYDAMISGRPYQKTISHEEALLEIKRCAGTQFDPNLVAAFCKLGFILC